MSAATEEFRLQMDAAERLQPGEAGWWKVWGARVYHVKPGDILVLKSEGGEELEYHEVETLSNEHVWVRFWTVDGDSFTLGALYPGFLLFRRSTHNILAP